VDQRRGHFVKMVHNGVEYGMMAAIAEASASSSTPTSLASRERTPRLLPSRTRVLLYEINVADVARSGATARSSVRGWWTSPRRARALAELSEFSGRVSDSGEGRWTVKAAIDESVPAPVIAASLFQRYESRDEGDFAARVLSAMRAQFGGHAEKPA